MKHRTVSVTEFKAQCVALLAEVEQNGVRLTITRRGRPLATVGPSRRERVKSPEGCLAGKIEFADDLHKLDLSDLFDCASPDGAQL